MPSHLFELRNIAYAYVPSRPSQADIDLTVLDGEKLAVLGANGSGKSTILKLLDGIIFADQGEIIAFGQRLSEKALHRNPYEFRRKVGLVFQDSDVQLFCATVYDEVAFALLQMDLPRAEVIRRVDGMLQELGLWELRDRPPYQLSGGEKKKVALASVLIYRPQVLLLDEPTNGLDPRTRKWLFGKLSELNASGTTLVMATHDLAAAKGLADRVVILNELHRIETVGSTDLLDDEPLLAAVNLA